MPELLQIADFKPHVGKIFRFKGTRYALPLDQIISNKRRVPKGIKRRPFTLIFRAPRTQDHLPEGFYESEVENGPTFTLYVIPVHTFEPEFQDYQVVFN